MAQVELDKVGAPPMVGLGGEYLHPTLARELGTTPSPLGGGRKVME